MSTADAGVTAVGGGRTERRWAWAALIGGGLCFVLLAWWLVPWHPVPGGTPEPVPASDVFTDAEIARAESYARWARVWSWSGLAVSVALACWLGFSRRARRIADRVRGPGWVRVLVLAAGFVLALRCITLPTSAAYRQLRVDAGLSTGAWTAWLRDLLVSDLVEIGVSAVALVIVIGLARQLPRVWPMAAGLLLAAAVTLGSFVYPVVIEPLFNDFASLPDGELRTAVFEVADAEGVAIEDVLVADASRRTTTLNAYVSGFGSTRRVVLYDNLVEDLPTDQALSVVAHELAHAQHHDVAVGTLLGAAGSLTAIGALALVMGRRRRGGAVPITSAAAVPTVLALYVLGSLLTQPIQNGISRQVETRADVVALRATEDPEGFIAMQRELAVRSRADPTPPAWSQWWFGSHPGVLERVAVVRAVGRG